jgi:hypothetical protein
VDQQLAPHRQEAAPMFSGPFGGEKKAHRHQNELTIFVEVTPIMLLSSGILYLV